MYLKINREEIREGLRRSACNHKKSFYETVISTFKELGGLKSTRRSIDYKELIDNNCINVLKKMNSELIQQYIGAAQSVAGDNVDRTRHTFVSMRTMWEQILSYLAPSDEALTWLKNNDQCSGDYIYEKDGVSKPTRFGRLLYAFRNQLSEGFFKIINNQIKAIKNFIDELQKVHKMALKFTRKKLKSFFMLGNTQLSSLRSIFT